MGNNKYEIFGVVVHGHGNGKKVGMPTANIDYKEKDNDIENGVYLSVVYLQKNEGTSKERVDEYIGVTNIGTRPSVDNDDRITVETNIIDFDEDIYGKEIELELIEKIRDIKKFDSLEEVKKQVDKDKALARKIYEEKRKEYDKEEN